ncbi:MAG: tRNA 4-thiouridine(8) synthase ThiI [Acidobacteria bacterium]|nr:tRNA 4-thiouridine(8) synthase ThiI [Acidobacteriota bacterium]
MDSVIVHYQEIALKGRNRPWFVERLVRNLRDATAGLDVVRVRPLMGRIELLLGPAADWNAVRERVGRIFGIANFARARRTDRGLEELAAAVIRDLGGGAGGATPAAANGGATRFRVRASRADKSFPHTSPEIEREVGGRIKAACGWRVDLRDPDVDVRVEVLADRAYYSLERHPGLGGLPSGASGHAMCLLSGGIDSPVAAYRVMRRGCRVRFVHFHAYPILSSASQEKVREIAALLTRYQLASRLYVVAFGELQQRVVVSAPPPLRVVLYRRLMMRIAERLARRAGARALVTGDAVGQVASQTLDNLAVVGEVVRLPVLRPLVGFDKDEITREARALGTYATSIIPDQDCCTLFTPRNPATRARRDEVERAEAALPIGEMVDAAVARAERQDFVFPEPGRR